MPEDVKFMQRAIELARHNALEAKAGGPFGCVIVRPLANGINVDKNHNAGAPVGAAGAARPIGRGANRHRPVSPHRFAPREGDERNNLVGL